MRTLINETQKHLIWRDEIQDEFLLTYWFEIFRYDKEMLKCYCWSRKVFLQLEKTNLIEFEYLTADRLYIFKTHQKNLHILLSMGVHSRRPNLEGVWIRDKKKRLAHDILKPGKLENLNQTIQKYKVTINGLMSIVEARSRSQAQYKAWKTHPDYDNSIKSIKDVKIKKIPETLDSVDNENGGV